MSLPTITIKHFLLAASLLFSSTFVNAQTVLTTDSKLETVTIYSQGASMHHTTLPTSIPKGSSELVINQIARQVNPESIRILSKDKSIKIHSVSFEHDYITSEENKSSSYLALKKEHEKQLDLLQSKTIARESEESTLSMLEANKNIGGANGISQSNLTNMLNYYRKEYKNLSDNLIKLKKEEEKQQKVVEKLAKQLAESGGENANAGQLVVNLYSDTALETSFEIDYYTYNVGWEPSYEIRVDDLEQPMNLVYNANLSQHTGIDWQQVSLNFSNGNPNINNNPPTLNTWWVSYRPENTNMPTSTYNRTMALKGSVENFALDEVVAESSMATVVSSQLQTSFVINTPYDVYTNKKPLAIQLQNYELPASYTYYSVPSKHEAAFLIAKVSDWEQYNLLPGQAQLIVDQLYAGKSYINPTATSDTLQISLGKDERIHTKRKRIDEKGSKPSFLGNTQKRSYTYEIELRNTRKEAATIEVKELFPVSTEKDIVVKLDQISGAKVNSEKGELTWKLDLKPNETKKILISYTISYPKGKNVLGL
ncbi:MAG TPA: DUF4139 domain-containing protein [Flavobacteriaceae bacterium]|nr:DUF4139 domain-containing protein [Flavobacteriaceae bacterium]